MASETKPVGFINEVSPITLADLESELKSLDFAEYLGAIQEVEDFDVEYAETVTIFVSPKYRITSLDAYDEFGLSVVNTVSVKPLIHYEPQVFGGGLLSVPCRMFYDEEIGSKSITSTLVAPLKTDSLNDSWVKNDEGIYTRKYEMPMLRNITVEVWPDKNLAQISKLLREDGDFPDGVDEIVIRRKEEHLHNGQFSLKQFFDVIEGKNTFGDLTALTGAIYPASDPS